MPLNGDFREPLRFEDPPGVPTDMTGASWRMQIRTPEGALIADIGDSADPLETGFYPVDASLGSWVLTIINDAIDQNAIPADVRVYRAQYDALCTLAGLELNRLAGPFIFTRGVTAA